MIIKPIIYFGKPVVLACDGQCGKAWGVQSRPSVEFDENDPDDMAYLSDGELGDAPVNPGTYEGGIGKPHRPEYRLNKWCARECERSIFVEDMADVKQIVLPDFSQRRYNQPWKHEVA